LKYPAAERITCREWLALGLILVLFVVLIALLIFGVVTANRVLKGG